MKYEEVDSVEKLRKLYDSPMDLAVKKQKVNLDQYSSQFLALSAFSILATYGASGQVDCSPRGDYPGFIQALDDKTIALPDRPGNNRLDSLTNIIERQNVGILALIPGFKECLRINGKAKIVTDADILERFEHRGKLPQTAIIVSIEEVYFHCSKAITRSKLWSTESQVDRSIMPSLGKILMNQIDPEKSSEEIKAVEDLIELRAKTTLY
mgnify:CR=1 FL=1